MKVIVSLQAIYNTIDYVFTLGNVGDGPQIREVGV